MSRGTAIQCQVALVLALCSTMVAAQQRTWTPIGTFEDTNATMLLDRASLQVKGSTRFIWSKVERVKPQDWQGVYLQSWLSRIEVNCLGKTQRTHFEIGYRPDNEVAYQITVPGEVTPVVPDTVGESRLEAICKLPAKAVSTK